MPEIGQAPSVIPVPALSEDEIKERREGLNEAFKLHYLVLDRLDAVLSSISEAEGVLAKLRHISTTVPSNRAVRLSRRLGLDALQFSLRGARGLVRAAAGTRRMASRGREEAEQLIVDPELLR